MQLGDDRCFATLTMNELAIAADGAFEILLASERPPGHRGNWLPIHPDARYLQIREYFTDWERRARRRSRSSSSATRAIRRPRSHPRAWPSCSTTLGEWVETTARFWTQWVDRMRADHDPAVLKPAARFVGGADDIYYGNDWFRLAPDEALVIETELPDARYWAFQLCDVWFRTMEYASRQSSLNHHQARIDADGRFPLRRRAPRSRRAQLARHGRAIPKA
jgi:hypothetical protein